LELFGVFNGLITDSLGYRSVLPTVAFGMIWNAHRLLSVLHTAIDIDLSIINDENDDDDDDDDNDETTTTSAAIRTTLALLFVPQYLALLTDLMHLTTNKIDNIKTHEFASLQRIAYVIVRSFVDHDDDDDNNGDGRRAMIELSPFAITFPTLPSSNNYNDLSESVRRSLREQPLFALLIKCKLRLSEWRRLSEKNGRLSETAENIKTTTAMLNDHSYVSIPVLNYRIVSLIHDINRSRNNDNNSQSRSGSGNNNSNNNNTHSRYFATTTTTTSTSSSEALRFAPGTKLCTLLLFAIFLIFFPFRWNFASKLVCTSMPDLQCRLRATGRYRSQMKSQRLHRQSRDTRMNHVLIMTC
jgi:hypothetical protein